MGDRLNWGRDEGVRYNNDYLDSKEYYDGKGYSDSDESDDESNLELEIAEELFDNCLTNKEFHQALTIFYNDPDLILTIPLEEISYISHQIKENVGIEYAREFIRHAHRCLDYEFESFWSED